jgi:hypothetical protein
MRVNPVNRLMTVPAVPFKATGCHHRMLAVGDAILFVSRISRQARQNYEFAFGTIAD